MEKPGTISDQLAKNLRDVYFGGNWTVSCYREHLKDVNWKEATTKAGSFNTIATLVFHTGYFVTALVDVLEGKPLTANDKFSFDHPPFHSEEDWQNFLEKEFKKAEHAAKLVAKLEDTKLNEVFVDQKFGTYYRNIAGTIEHLHYHLGQLVIIKKLLREK